MSDGHWFDQLSTRLTRRQVVKGALVGAAALAGATPGASTARADASEKCFKGCVWTANQRYEAAKSACLPSVYSIGGPYAAIARADRAGCLDKALLAYKADWYDCAQPGCSGFDPKQKGGPCDGCSNNCCTCQASTNGYICCVFTCDDPMHNCCPGG
jgi:hypothetical protein